MGNIGPTAFKVISRSTEEIPEVNSLVQATIWTLLAVAVILAIARIVIRVRRFRRIFVDDVCLFIATVALIGGTIITSNQVPFLFTAQDLQNGTETVPDDFIKTLGSHERNIAATLVLLWSAIFGVKFSFCFLFRSLIRRVRYLNLWWWCVAAFLVPSAALCTFSAFIGCPVFGASALSMLCYDPLNVPAYTKNETGKCFTPSALRRQNASIIYSGVLDILTDTLSKYFEI